MSQNKELKRRQKIRANRDNENENSFGDFLTSWQGNVNCHKGHDDPSNIYGNTIIFVRYAYL